MATGDDFLWPPETFEHNDDPALAQKLQATVDIIFAQLRRLQSSASASGLPEPATNGDLIRRAAGAWARLGIGTAGQALIVVSALPAWSNDGHALLIDAGNIDSGVLPTARYLHNLLSIPHQDSTPASAVLGDLIVAQAAAAADVDAFWLDGAPYDEVPNVSDGGEESYWIDGLPAAGLETAGTVTWQRKANSTTAGYVLTSGATGPDWQPLTGVSLGASVYRATDLIISDRTHTVIPLSNVITDDGSFWSAGTPSRLTVPAGQAGWYVVVGQIATLAATGRKMYAEVYVNGALRARFGGNHVTVQCSAVVKLAVGDYVELYGYTDQDVPFAYTETALGGSTSTLLSMVRT